MTCENFIPTPRGSYKTAPIFTTLGTAGAGPSTPGTGLAAIALQTAAGTSVVNVGTTTKLYTASTTDFQAGTFTDRSPSAYSVTSWSFAQFGNYTIAAALGTPPQVRDATGSSNFATLSGSPPTGKIVVVQSNVVLLFSISGALNSWAASDVGSHTTWSGGDAVATTAILHRPGEITAAIAFRDYVLVFKKNSIYMMRYVGSPIYWTVDLLDDTRGVSSLGAVANCGDVVIFSGAHGVTVWDGSGFRDISDGFQLESGLSNLSLNVGADGAVYFPAERNVVFFTAGTQAWVYNVQTDQWGYFYAYRSGTAARTGLNILQGTPSARADAIGGIAADLSNGGMCLIGLAATGTGTDDVVLQSTDSFAPDASVYAKIGTTYMGAENEKTLFKRVYPIASNTFANSLPAATGLTLNYNVQTSPYGSIGSTTATSSSTPHRFDIMTASNFGAFELRVTGGYYEIEDMLVETLPAGKE